MNSYFWSAVDYVYNNRVTPSEGVSACGSGAVIGGAERGNFMGAGLGCGVSLMYEILSKLFNGNYNHPITSEEDIDPNDVVGHYEAEADFYLHPVPDSVTPIGFGPLPCRENGGLCPLPDTYFGPSITFESNSDTWPTVGGNCI